MKKSILLLMVLPLVACGPDTGGGGGAPIQTKLTLKKHYSGNNKESSKLDGYDVYQYDGNGNLVRILNYVSVVDNDDRLTDKVEYETKVEDDLTCKTITRTSYKNTGEIDGYYINTEKYDKDSMLVYKASEDLNPSGTYTYYDRTSYSYQFNSQGLLTEKIAALDRSYNKTVSHVKNVYSYNEDGDITQDIKYIKSKEADPYTENSKITYEYSDVDDATIVRIATYSYDTTWKLNYSEQRKYNKAGLEVLHEKINTSNVVTEKEEYLYNENVVTKTEYELYNNVLKKRSEDVQTYDAPYTGHEKLLSTDSLLYDGKTKAQEGVSFQYNFDSEGRQKSDIRIYFDIYSGERVTTYYSEELYIYE